MNKLKSKAGQHNRLIRIITTPVRALCKARDFYVKSITSYADNMNYGNMAVQIHGLPRSFSVNAARSHGGDDLRELRRATSARNIGARVNLDSYVMQQMAVNAGSRGGSRAAMPPRSRSVAMGRIDEESPCCYFGDQDNINKMSNIINVKNDSPKCPRSRSHSVTRNVF